MYCKQIKLNLTSADFNRIRGPHLETFGLSYHNRSILEPDYLAELVKEQIKFIIPPDHIYYTEITEEGLGCHVDNSSVALNYCVTSPQSSTHFFKPKANAQAVMIDNYKQSETLTSRTYEWRPEDLDLVHSVIIAPHTAWLLNTHAVHCVRKYGDQVRAHIRWVWRDVPYKIVEASIKELQ